jgi:hypothetical protein
MSSSGNSAADSGASAPTVVDIQEETDADDAPVVAATKVSPFKSNTLSVI